MNVCFNFNLPRCRCKVTYPIGIILLPLANERCIPLHGHGLGQLKFFWKAFGNNWFGSSCIPYIVLPFIVVIKSAIFLSLICVWIISAGGLSSHKSESSDLSSWSLNLLYGCVIILLICCIYAVLYFIYWVWLQYLGSFLVPFTMYSILCSLWDSGNCFWTYLVIFLLCHCRVASCLLMFCHISSDVWEWVLKVVLYWRFALN